ncbi:hypothetical protein LCGC14_1808700 [marine sediment metagenome]|uniref:Uncharacterized protein n=1 Tax=marine sediment metagenome TaxID=412755 RepID=A0A0F9JM27_9ZZZZ
MIKLNGMSTTAKWVSGMIAICLFFGSIIIGMATIPTRDMRDDIESHEVQIRTLSVQQAVIETKLDNISDDVKEIKGMLTK